MPFVWQRRTCCWCCVLPHVRRSDREGGASNSIAPQYRNIQQLVVFPFFLFSISFSPQKRTPERMPFVWQRRTCCWCCVLPHVRRSDREGEASNSIAPQYRNI